MEAPTHRKIELQSPADMLFLVANARTAAREKLDLHFPPAAAPAGEPDALRSRVEELVNEYILQTYALAKHNISINGLEVDDSPELAGLWTGDANNGTEKPQIEEYEPFDTRLSSRLQSLSATLERETVALAALRREAPARAAAAYLDAERKAQLEDDFYDQDPYTLESLADQHSSQNTNSATQDSKAHASSKTNGHDAGTVDVNMTGTGTGTGKLTQPQDRLNSNKRKRPFDLLDISLDPEDNRDQSTGAEAGGPEGEDEAESQKRQQQRLQRQMRIREMARMYDRAVGALVAERGKVTGTVARCERARRAGEYVESMK